MTDRAKIKDQQKGVYLTAAGISDASGEVESMHTKTFSTTVHALENAATNVTERPVGIIKRLSKVKAISIVPPAAVANDATDYIKVYVYKYTSAGATQTLLGSWNSATAAQGAMTAYAKHSLSLVTAAVKSVSADSTITFHVGKFGAGKVLGNCSVTVDHEEI